MPMVMGSELLLAVLPLSSGLGERRGDEEQMQQQIRFLLLLQLQQQQPRKKRGREGAVRTCCSRGR